MDKSIILDLNRPKIQYTIRSSEDSYRFLIHEVIEQMLSTKAGIAIYNRLDNLCDGDITPEAIASLSDEQIRCIGTSNSKVSFI